MKAAAPLAARPSVADKFRLQIQQALAEGAALDALTLHLTRGDAEQLKRDRKTPVADVSFAGGTMRYLGVTVVAGDVPASVLRRTDTDQGAGQAAGQG